jgi:hypothetical protein
MSHQAFIFRIILFLIAKEPLNRLLKTAFRKLMYTTDDNLSPLALEEANQIHPILTVYAEYTW